jgi:hypothetical protein
MPVLVSLRLERSGREESVRAGSCCPVCEEAGNLSPLRGWFSWVDGTQRSRAGLSSDGPPGLGPRLGTRSCAGASGSNPVLLREFSIPIPMPIPIPTRDARVCRSGSSSAGDVSVGRHVGWEQCLFATFCDFCGHPPGIEAKGAHEKTRRTGRGRGSQGMTRAGTRRRRGGGTKSGFRSMHVLVSLRLERSGREESIRAGRCTACETAEPLPG